MNKFTKTEALPKTGHVNEVCKEWLVREDGALAYKLQSQEINHFYKGNRFRNGMVREDFPVALHEQIKEKENAEKQAEFYRRRLLEQEEYDKRIAKEITENLERDLQEQQQRDLQASEIIAQQMQEIYVNLPQPPPTGARDKSKPPPRPTKATFLQQISNEANTSSGSNNKHPIHHSTSRQQQQQLSNHNNNNYNGNGYLHSSHHNVAAPAHLLVSDEFSSVSSPHQKQQQQSPFNQFVERSNKSGRPHPALTTDNFPMQQQHYENAQQVMQQQQQQHRHKHSPSANSSLPLSLSSSSSSSSSSSAATAAAAARRNVFESLISPNSSPALNPFHAPNSPRSSTFAPSLSSLLPSTPTTPHSNHHHSHQQPPVPLPPTPSVEELVEYSDVADSIRRYDISPDSKDAFSKGIKPTTPKTITTPQEHHTHSLTPPTTTTTAKTPPSSAHTNNFNKMLSPSNENLLRADHKFQKLSPEKYDQLVGNEGAEGPPAEEGSEQPQEHTDDIELYVDPCDYASLKEIGLPMDEIKEMSKKLKQEQKDELLARRLQEMESNDGLSQEERDRLLAIEAQDKELAKMLQEREKAKAKRAKEKARQRKSQHKESNSMTTSCSSIGNGLHCGPLLALPQDCMSLSKHLGGNSASNHSPHNPSVGLNLAASASREELLDMEAYANPIDVINQQRLQNGSINGGSLSREQCGMSVAHDDIEGGRDDDIYALPVDSCRPGQRPASLNIGPETGHGSHNNSMTRSENYSLDSHDSLLSGHDVSPRMNYSNSSKNGSFDHNSSPTPPYMPIQGTRRSNSSEERKKKSKDKCTHQ